MNEEGALFDSGFDDTGPFRVTPDAGGVSLESALRDFGPAAIDDLIPRLRAIAARLDAAHHAGAVHGALHPRTIWITDDSTSLLAGSGSARPYLAPEVAAGGVATPAADQFAFAAIAYEWMFGKPISGPAERPVEVRNLPGIDRAALSKAFSRALAPEPSRRFASCAAFCAAVQESVVPSLPLGALADDEDPVEPFVPEAPPAIPDLPIIAEESTAAAAQPDLDVINPGPSPIPAVAVDSWRPSAMAIPERQPTPRFGALALILATLLGAVFGFAAGYMARPRALQTAPIASGLSAEDAPAPTPAPVAPKAPETPTPARKAPEAPQAQVPSARIGRLLVRSSPSGASVSVDGVSRGVTPLALRELDLGAREIAIERRGYIAEKRRVVLTEARPSRSVEVRLSAAAAAAPVRPAPPASQARPAATAGVLAVESRPPGAAVTINGKPVGVTPLTINDLAPGDYRITMTLAGYRDFATTVRVVAGERVRAAASLTAQEQE